MPMDALSPFAEEIRSREKQRKWLARKVCSPCFYQNTVDFSVLVQFNVWHHEFMMFRKAPSANSRNCLKLQVQDINKIC